MLNALDIIENLIKMKRKIKILSNQEGKND